MPCECEEKLLQYATAKSITTADIPLDEGWKKIQENGIRVLVRVLQGAAASKRPFGNKGYVSLYTISYRMCSNAGSSDHSRDLYHLARKEIKTYLIENALAELRCTSPTEDAGATLLSKFAHHWENHKVFVKWMQQLFRHLDNGYVSNASISTITSVGFRLFYDVVFHEFKSLIAESVIRMINRDRDGQLVDVKLLRLCIEVFCAMGTCSKVTNLKSVDSVFQLPQDLSIYESELESSLLQKTAEFYAEKSTCWLRNMSTPGYLICAEDALLQETQRIQRYLNVSSKRKMLCVCERELLHRHRNVLVDQEDSGLITLVSQGKRSDLQRMYALFGRIPDGLKPMADAIRQYVRQQGKLILQQHREQAEERINARRGVSDEPSMIHRFLRLQETMNDIVAVLFEGENLFQRSLKEAMQDIINTDAVPETSNVEMLVAHTDRILSGKTKMPEEQLENALDQITQLFLFLSDKDLFVEVYRNLLAKRLLARRFVSIHTEKCMISKIKAHQGAPFTTKLEGMINDFTVGNADFFYPPSNLRTR